MQKKKRKALKSRAHIIYASILIGNAVISIGFVFHSDVNLSSGGRGSGAVDPKSKEEEIHKSHGWLGR